MRAVCTDTSLSVFMAALLPCITPTGQHLLPHPPCLRAWTRPLFVWCAVCKWAARRYQSGESDAGRRGDRLEIILTISESCRQALKQACFWIAWIKSRSWLFFYIFVPDQSCEVRWWMSPFPWSFFLHDKMNEITNYKKGQYFPQRKGKKNVCESRLSWLTVLLVGSSIL